MGISPIGGLAPEAESNVLQSFSDATAGRSLQLYWCSAMTDSVGRSYVLAREAGNSNPKSQFVQANPYTFDFDVTINKSTLFAGIGYIDFKLITAGNITTKKAVTVSIYYYDGSETLISSVSVTPELDNGTYYYKLPLTITRKSFKPGDVLRCKVVIPSSTQDATIYFDPLTAGDEMKLWVPVVNLE